MYLGMIVAFFLVLPVLSTGIELAVRRRRGDSVDGIAVAGRWFVFWVVGVRLLLAGLGQAVNPSYTAQSIFGTADPAVLPFVSELEFANIAFGVLGVASLVIPGWVAPAALVGAVFLGLDGNRHVLDGGPYTQERLIAMITDRVGLVVLGAFLLIRLSRVRRNPSRPTSRRAGLRLGIPARGWAPPRRPTPAARCSEPSQHLDFERTPRSGPTRGSDESSWGRYHSYDVSTTPSRYPSSSSSCTGNDVGLRPLE